MANFSGIPFCKWIKKNKQPLEANSSKIYTLLPT